MSGIMTFQAWVKILSACVVVGPFASSRIMFALIFQAFSVVIAFSNAAGTSISISSSNNLSPSIFSTQVRSNTDFHDSFNELISFMFNQLGS